MVGLLAIGLLTCHHIFLYIYSPYSSADLNLMASAFNMNISQLESELMNLILEGQIQARIDSHNKVISKYLPYKHRTHSGS